MALSIESDEAARLARELAAEPGESLTEAVVAALRERLARQRSSGRGRDLIDRIRRLQNEVGALPVLDERTPDEIIGYDERGIPA